MTEQSTRYGLPAIVIHWLSAVLIIALCIIGWYMVDLPRGPGKGYWISLHKSIGITVAGLILFRMLWRLTHRPPDLPASMPFWKRAIAHLTHAAIYVALVVQPLSGYLSSSFSGYKTKYFGIPLPHWGWRDASLNQLFTDVHVICSITIVVLVLAHVIGALMHLFVNKDGVFQRMVPGIGKSR